MIDPLQNLIGKKDYETLRTIRNRAGEESRLHPAQLQILGVYEVNFLIRLLDRIAEEARKRK